MFIDNKIQIKIMSFWPENDQPNYPGGQECEQPWRGVTPGGEGRQMIIRNRAHS